MNQAHSIPGGRWLGSYAVRVKRKCHCKVRPANELAEFAWCDDSAGRTAGTGSGDPKRAKVHNNFSRKYLRWLFCWAVSAHTTEKVVGCTSVALKTSAGRYVRERRGCP